MSNIDHQATITQEKIEVIDFIEDQNLNFHRGNAVKYIARAGIKTRKKRLRTYLKPSGISTVKLNCFLKLYPKRFRYEL